MTDPTPSSRAPSRRPIWRRRLARLALLLGVLFVALQASRIAPVEQTLEFRSSHPPHAGRLTATWTRENESEPAGGVTLHFPEGVPKRIQHKVSLPNGRYVVTLQLETSPGTVQANLTHHVTLEGGSTIIAL